MTAVDLILDQVNDPITIIARNTRNGHVAWQNVARQLGRSEDAIRSQYDPTYMRRNDRPWPHPCEAVEFEPTDVSSPYAKTPGLKTKILTVLHRHTASAESIAYAIGGHARSIRSRLGALHASGLVQRSCRLPYTWSLTEAGRKVVTLNILGSGDKL